jgi:N-methylhydantoinase A/oxoprolinase/acetone carboxylase beta subunit
VITVGIDTGGTFTDSFVSVGDGEVATVKVETTPHDLTVCFADAIEASARAVGLSQEDFLRQAEIIRFSSTIGTNTVVTRSGPKLGLIVTLGAEHELYGAAEGETLFGFIPKTMVAGIRESVSRDGSVESAPDPEEVGRVAKALLEQGARILVVSLGNATANPANERAVKALIDASYPRHYLGAVPVHLSTEINATADDARRTAAAIVNAYMHKKLASSLYRAEDDLRRTGYRHPLLVVTADGGVTRVAKTRALSTYQSGPTSGIHASALLCTALGVDVALTADVGGTSTDVGLVVSGRPVRRNRIDVGGLPVAQPSVELVSFGIGGGSIATVADGRVHVGPESAGAAPGPACFGLGGLEATPTDAWLVLGYLDPDFYLGGRKRLDFALARRALEEQIARPLEVSAEEAALAVNEATVRAVVDGIEATVALDRIERELTGRHVSELALVAYGGGGGILMPAVARRLGISRTILSRFSPIFSAFGISTFDVRHTYEARVALDGSSAARAIESLAQAARRDMRGEGFDPRATAVAVSVFSDDGTPLAEDVPEEKVDRIDLPRGAPLRFSLAATCSVPKPPLPEESADAGEDPSNAEKGAREIRLGDTPVTATVYARERLRAGNVIRGPALVEASDTTYLVPERVRCRVDRFGNAVLSEEA